MRNISRRLLSPRRLLEAALPGVWLALAGCVNQAKDVAVYRRELDRNAPVVALVPGGPLTLAQALAATNAHNERLALAGEDYLQALIEKDRSVAAFLPVLSLQPSYFRMDVPPVPDASSHGWTRPPTLE